MAEQADAKRGTINGAAALALLEDVDEIYAAKGKRVHHVDLRREKPSRPTSACSAEAPARPAQPLTPPAVSPSTMYFCR